MSISGRWVSTVMAGALMSVLGLVGAGYALGMGDVTPMYGMDSWFFGAGYCLCWSAYFLLWLIIAYLVYEDAKERGDDRAAIWFIVVLLLGLIGVVLYLLLREERRPVYSAPPPR